MNAQSIALITDSGTGTPQSFVAEHDIRVVPLLINFSDGRSLRSGIDIQSDELLDELSQEIPSTSTPSPASILSVFKQAKADGYKRAIYVGISSGLSATFETAQLAASQIEDFDVSFIDTKSIGLGAGLSVMAAAKLLRAGCAIEDILAKLESQVQAANIYFVTKTLTFLRKGGRISEATYRLGSILNIKPIITCEKERGTYQPVKKPRGWEKALDKVVDLICSSAQNYAHTVLGICCTKATDVHELLRTKISARLGNVVEVIETSLSPELLVHTGPDFVGVTVQPALEL